MKRLFVVAMVWSGLLLLVGCGADWKVRSYPGGGFQVASPGSFGKTIKKVPTEVGKMDMHTYTLQKSSVIFMIAYADYPAGLVAQSGVTATLDGAGQGAMRNIGGRGDVDKVTFLGFEARKLSASVSRGSFKANLRGLIFLKKDRLYQVMIIAKKSEDIDAVFDKFSSSFKLLDGQKTKSSSEEDHSDSD